MTVYPVPTPIVVGGTLPAAQVGVAYSAALTASGGIAPYSWSAYGLPAGLDFGDGTISGTPTVAGTSTVTIDTSDAINQTARSDYTLTVNPAAASCPPSIGREVRGSGRITAIANGSITVGLKKLAISSCTEIRLERGATALRLGQSVRWEGRSSNGVIDAKRIETR